MNLANEVVLKTKMRDLRFRKNDEHKKTTYDL
jgi:hypothetical protein